MNTDDNNSRRPAAGSGSGGSAILERDQGKGVEGQGGTRELKSVRLVCLFCREVRIIHVPVRCDTPKEVLWECLACQERWAARK